VCKRACVRARVYMRACVRVCVCVCVRARECERVYVRVGVCACACACECVFVRARVCVCVYVSVLAHKHACTSMKYSIYECVSIYEVNLHGIQNNQHPNTLPTVRFRVKKYTI